MKLKDFLFESLVYRGAESGEHVGNIQDYGETCRQLGRCEGLAEGAWQTIEIIRGYVRCYADMPGQEVARIEKAIRAKKKAETSGKAVA